MVTCTTVRTLLSCVLISTNVSCSVVPSTEDIVDLDTSLIKAAIHCEMRDAFIEMMVYAVGRDGQATNVAAANSLRRETISRYIPPSSDPDIAAEQRAAFEAEVYRTFLSTGYKKLHDDELKFAIETYTKIYIGYRFQFDITRHDNVGASISIANAFTRGTLMAPIGGSVDGSRQAINDTAQMDVVGQLLSDRARIRVCNTLNAGKRPPNYSYPIAGKLGLKRYAKEFITDNQSGNLIGQYSDASLLTSADQPPRPSESWSLTFKTTLKGGLNDAVLEIDDLRSGTSVGGASLNLASERIDIHKLTIVMQLPPQNDGLTVAQRRNQAERSEAAASLAAELNRFGHPTYVYSNPGILNTLQVR